MFNKITLAFDIFGTEWTVNIFTIYTCCTAFWDCFQEHVYDVAEH